MKPNLLKSIAIALLFSVALNPLLSQDDITETKTLSIEDWETGDFSQYEWQFAGNAEWLITDQNPYEGVYSAQSGDINDNQTSTLYLEYEVYSPENISFWLKVSSESNYDYLRFYIDNTEMDAWAGEVPWQEVSFPVTAGFHTFKWEYDKDYSVSTGADACWIDYIVFPPMEIEALFTADTTVICKNDIVYFFDQSIGPVTEWSWIFEGATPSSSTNQNPVVAYPTEGEWDVSLEVSDGIETATLYMGNFITVGDVPTPAPTPSGISLLCANWGNTSYNTTGLSGITEYDWIIDPPEAGTISGAGTNVTVIWEEDFLGEADLMVAGINYCGIGAYSEPYTIVRYLPDVSVMLPAFVALSTPPFELTGGLPVGGEYTGPGVTNGIFDPAAAGLGMHTITYTYTDNNFCTNSAIDSIGVTQYTGIVNQADQSAVDIYPNPNNGSFKIRFDLTISNPVDLSIFNPVSGILHERKDIKIDQKNVLDIQMDQISSGIYFLRVSNSEINLIKKIIIRK
jgi:PKD repeat protein